MKKFTTAVAVTLLGATIAFAAPHQGGREGHEGKRGGFGKKIAQELNLTDAQKAQLKAIKQDSRARNKAFFEQSHQTMMDFFAARKANDPARMDSLKPAADAARAQMKTIRAAEDAKIASILTSDQNAKWQQLKGERAARHANKQ